VSIGAGTANDTWTIERTQENSNVRTITVGDQIAAGVTAKNLFDIENAVTGNTAALNQGSNVIGGLTPTQWRFNGTFGTDSFSLQYLAPNTTTWEDFTIKGINYGPTPPGYNPSTGLTYDSMSNLSQVQWFAEQFGKNNMGGNTIRCYFTYSPGNATQGVMGQANIAQWRKALDIFYANGIYAMIDIYVNFYSSYNTSQLTEWYQNEQATAMLTVVDLLGDHPAVMGYLFGNETNDSGNIASYGMTLAKWWTYANSVAGAIKSRDTNHIVGISSGINIPNMASIVAVEDAGTLNNFDFHGANSYLGSGWNDPIEGTPNYFASWNPTNNKPLIITETGVDAWDQTTSALDLATQASACGSLWETFDPTRCAGLIYFEAFDEWWKTGGGGGTTGSNDGVTQGTSGNVANSDNFYMPNDQFGNEQYWGWWTYCPFNPFQAPPTARTVVNTMKGLWT
jgi:hypothetical protein